jgi:hypothetical protein
MLATFAPWIRQQHGGTGTTGRICRALSGRAGSFTVTAESVGIGTLARPVTSCALEVLAPALWRFRRV